MRVCENHAKLIGEEDTEVTSIKKKKLQMLKMNDREKMNRND